MTIVKDVRQLKTKYWQHKAGTIGEVVTEAEDIGQCLETIAKTEKGTVPHNPNLGSNMMQFQDKPLNVVAPKMKVVLMKDFNVQESRASIDSIEFYYTAAKNGHVDVKIAYTIKTTGEKTTREITLW